VAAAASVLHLHPNTLRYRLRRSSELFELSLDDPDGRLAAWMFLRLNPTYTVPGQPADDGGSKVGPVARSS
jgi:DNA-binding PucR family transcriptional regulator